MADVFTPLISLSASSASAPRAILPLCGTVKEPCDSGSLCIPVPQCIVEKARSILSSCGRSPPASAGASITNTNPAYAPIMEKTWFRLNRANIENGTSLMRYRHKSKRTVMCPPGATAIGSDSRRTFRLSRRESCAGGIFRPHLPWCCLHTASSAGRQGRRRGETAVRSPCCRSPDTPGSPPGNARCICASLCLAFCLASGLQCL